MSWIAFRIIAPLVHTLGINLNWIFDPFCAWQRREPVRLKKVLTNLPH